MSRISVVFILAFVPNVAFGQVYRCEVDGELIFSQQPCAVEAELIQERIEPDPNAAPQAGYEAQEGYEDNSTYIQRVRLERRIGRHQARIRQLQRQMDSETANIRQRMRHASNNLAGATYLQSLSTEMQAVSSNYSSQIENEQRAIDRLNDELQRL